MEAYKQLASTILYITKPELRAFLQASFTTPGIRHECGALLALPTGLGGSLLNHGSERRGNSSPVTP